MSPVKEQLVLPSIEHAPDDKEKQKRHKLLWKYNTNKPITCLGISASGQRVIMGGKDHYIYFFDKDKELLWDYNCLSTVKCVYLTPNGSGIVVGTERHVLFLNAKGDLVWDNKVGAGVNKVIASNSCDLIIAGTESKKILFFDNAGNSIKQQRTVAEVTNLCKADDDSFFIATSEATILMFDRGVNLIWNYKTQWNIQTITISGRGEIIVAGAMTSLYCINNRRDLLWKHTGKNVAEVIEVSRSKDFIVIGSRDGILSSYNVVGDLLWQYRTGSVKATAQKVVTKGVTATAINHTGEYIAVGSVNKNVYMLSRDQDLLYKFEAAHEIEDLVMDEVGTSVAVIAGNTIYYLENSGLYFLLFEHIGGHIREAHSHRINISKTLDFYRTAVDSYNKGNIQTALNNIHSVDKQIASEQKVVIKRVLSNITIKMAKAEVAGVDLEAIKAMLGKAKDVYKQDGFYTSMEHFQRIMLQLENIMPESAPQVAIPAPILASSPIPPTPPKRRKPAPQPVKAAPAPQRPVESLFSLKKEPTKTERPPPETSMIRTDPYRREATNRISLFESKIYSLKREGVNVSALEDMLSTAKVKVEKGGSEEAIEIIERGQADTEELQKTKTKKKALDLLSFITEKITKAKSKGLETTDFENTMAKSVKAFDRDMFEECISIIRKLDVEMDQILIKTSPRYDIIKNRIRELEEEVLELRNERMNTLELEDLVEDCWTHLDSDLDFTDGLVQDAREKIDGLKDQHEIIMKDFKEAQSRIESLERKGYNTSTVQGIYHDALIVLYSGNMKMAKEHLEQMKDELAEFESQTGEGGFEMPTGVDDPLVNTLKNRINQLEEEVIVKTEEMSRKEHEISELYIVIKELEQKVKEAKESKMPNRECPDCDAEVPDLRFCGLCGHEFERFCLECGTVIPKGFIFCGKCGTKVE